MRNFIKTLDISGIFLALILVLQPISDFIKTNLNDQVFNLARSLSYYIIFIIIYLLGLFSWKLIFKKIKPLYFSLFYSLFILISFNYYIINSLSWVKTLNENGKGEYVFAIFFIFFIFSFYTLSKLIFNNNFRYIVYSIFLSFFTLDLFLTMPNYYNYLNYQPSIKFEMPEKVKRSENLEMDFPNVYFLIPDAFPPERSLKNIYKEDFKYEHINKLKNYGFTVLNIVKANALVLYSSIPHFFSMDYFFKELGPVRSSLNVEMKNLFKGHNPVVGEFRKRNYKFIRVDGEGHIAGCTGIEDICIKGKDTILNNQDIMFLERSYIVKILFRMSESQSFGKVLTALKINPNNNVNKNGKYMHDVHDLQLTDSLITNDNFEQILPEISESPYFYFWWLPFPHAPIRFNSDCSLIKRENWPNPYDDNYNNWSKVYLEQNKCADKFILSIAKKIIEHDENAIILIHSDHGMDHNAVKSSRVDRGNLNKKSINNLLNAFAAYRIPTKCRKTLYNKNNSPVNAFRIIFACLDNKIPEMLEYKAFLLDDEYENVIKILNKKILGD